jgi:hypothetical protein
MQTQIRLTSEELARLSNEAGRLDAHSVYLTIGDNVVAAFLGTDDETLATAAIQPDGEIVFFTPEMAS